MKRTDTFEHGGVLAASRTSWPRHPGRPPARVGITAAAVADGLLVVEVIRPERAERCRLAKSDPIEAYQAAWAALGNHRIALASGRFSSELSVVGPSIQTDDRTSLRGGAR